MPWFKIDDGFWSHPKVLELSPDAVALWVRAGSYCAGHLTDGEVKPSILRLMGATDEHADELTRCGLWDFTDGSWWFHDWAEYQPSRETVLAERAATRERVAKHRSQRSSNSSSNGVTNGATNGVSTPAPTRPDPTSTSNEVERTATRGSRLPEAWMPSELSRARAAKDAPLVDLRRETETFRDYWTAQPGQKGVKVDWDATWRNWMRRKQDDLTARQARPTPEQRARQTMLLATDLVKEIDQ
jgi:hypothetical protein